MFPNFYWATVTDNVDPDKLNRVKVAKINNDESITDWVSVLTPCASAEAGLSILPDVGDEVLVVSQGIQGVRDTVLGSSWTNEIAPPQTGENTAADLNDNGENALEFFRSRSGNQLIFDDTGGDEKIQLISADGKSRLEFMAADELASLATEYDLSIGAKGALSIQAEEIEISSEKQINMSGEEYQVDAKKDMGIETDKDLTVKGSGVSLN